MAFIPTVGGAKTVVKFLVNGHVCTNSLWWYKFGFTSADLAKLALDVDAAYAGDLVELISNEASYVNTTAYDMQTVFGEVVINDTSAGAGTQEGQALPASVAICITLRTAGRGRSARGRVYVPGFGEDGYNDGLWDAAECAAVVTILEATKVICAVDGWTMSVCSFQENGVPLTAGNLRPVTTIESRSRIPANQRRRAGRP